MPDPVLPLGDPVASEPSVSGGKGATLARLLALDLPVPDGVVVTTEAYRDLVDDAGIETLFEDLDEAIGSGEDDAQFEVAAELRDAIRSRPLPSDVVDALDRSLPDGPYAVRSSATSEDLPEASFAGQYDTHVGVERGEELHATVLGCMASLFTDRAVAYRARNGVPTATVRMAVVVQRLVEPDVSGILFSADPISGNRTVSVVDAGPGRGEAQVSGRTTADSIRYDRRREEVVDYRVGEGRTERVLGEDDVRALAAVGARIEDALGAPQDVEWAMRDGELYVLQARPITALFPVPEPRAAEGRTQVYYSVGHRQGMPDAMPPLVLDGWRDLTERVGRTFGLSRRVAATAGGRLYVDLTAYLRDPRLRERVLANFHLVDDPAGDALGTLLAKREEDFPLRDPTPLGYLRALRPTVRVLRAAWPILRSLPRALLVEDPAGTSDRVRAAYETASEGAVARIRSRDTTAERLAAANDELVGSLGWLLEPFYPPFLAGMLAGRLLRRLFPDRREEVDALALGIRNDVVYRMTMELGDLADVARGSPAVAAAVRDGASLADLESVDGSGPFLEEFDGFLDEYGFRAVGEIDWSRPRYREDPRPLLNVVGGYLETGGTGEHRRTAERLKTRAREAERTLVREAGPLTRPLVKRLAAVHRNAIGIREHPKFWFARLLAELRERTLAAGEELASSGALPDAEAVWLLTADELRAGIEDPRTLVGVDIARRRRDFERFERLDAPRVVTSDGEVPRPGPAGAESEATLSGTGAAPGVVEGVVRVVTDPGAERLDRGEVLVAPYTDPGWTPLFLNAAAVVTEVGGRLTHGSLVAREYGIPAVVAVADATTRLHTGDRVRVDGGRGVVEVLEEASAGAELAGAARRKKSPRDG
ncbi:PEP/pyruvate-binding domain-containing protein [Halorarum salinum]|uniref:Phosphoenolpyruvate synthase n=1 Tax=Halorarum salinum TaxID=2743089 RepID=A0A7D5QAP9_9EURY|nr:PEP/pyruvate-binding domain-containing protein [Halobaculum salinum]QLG61140.1 hypothetical protein HUG12_05090 [Halobaculum salinum]